jgi:hypothetical protein
VTEEDDSEVGFLFLLRGISLKSNTENRTPAGGDRDGKAEQKQAPARWVFESVRQRNHHFMASSL